MYALRERRVHVTQEDFELAVAKVKIFTFFSKIYFLNKYILGHAKRFGEECFIKKTLEMINLFFLSANFFALRPFFFFLL
jgi:hypothetical protein